MHFSHLLYCEYYLMLRIFFINICFTEKNKLEKNVFTAICRSRDIHRVGDSVEQSLGSKAIARGAGQTVCSNVLILVLQKQFRYK